MKFATTAELNEFLKNVKSFADFRDKEYTYIQTFDLFLFETGEGLKVWSTYVEESEMTIHSNEGVRTPSDDDLFCIQSEIERQEKYLSKLKALIA